MHMLCIERNQKVGVSQAQRLLPPYQDNVNPLMMSCMSVARKAGRVSCKAESDMYALGWETLGLTAFMDLKAEPEQTIGMSADAART